VRRPTKAHSSRRSISLYENLKRFTIFLFPDYYIKEKHLRFTGNKYLCCELDISVCISSLGRVKLDFSFALGPSATVTTGKIGVVVQPFFAVCPRMIKISLPCAQVKTHGKDLGHGKDRHKRTVKIRFTPTMKEAAR
jgi:hypothetical protein